LNFIFLSFWLLGR